MQNDAAAEGIRRQTRPDEAPPALLQRTLYTRRDLLFCPCGECLPCLRQVRSKQSRQGQEAFLICVAHIEEEGVQLGAEICQFVGERVVVLQLDDELHTSRPYVRLGRLKQRLKLCDGVLLPGLGRVLLLGRSRLRNGEQYDEEANPQNEEGMTGQRWNAEGVSRRTAMYLSHECHLKMFRKA